VQEPTAVMDMSSDKFWLNFTTLTNNDVAIRQRPTVKMALIQAVDKNHHHSATV